MKFSILSIVCSFVLTVSAFSFEVPDDLVPAASVFRSCHYEWAGGKAIIDLDISVNQGYFVPKWRVAGCPIYFLVQDPDSHLSVQHLKQRKKDGKCFYQVLNDETAVLRMVSSVYCTP